MPSLLSSSFCCPASQPTFTCTSQARPPGGSRVPSAEQQGRWWKCQNETTSPFKSLLFKHQSPKHYVRRKFPSYCTDAENWCEAPTIVFTIWEHSKSSVLKYIYIDWPTELNTKNSVTHQHVKKRKKRRETRTRVSTDTSALTAREPQTFLLPITGYYFRAILDHILLNDKNSASRKNSAPIAVIQKKNTHFIQGCWWRNLSSNPPAATKDVFTR